MSKIVLPFPEAAVDRVAQTFATDQKSAAKLIGRFAPKVEVADGCWHWTGAITAMRGGYGRLMCNNRVIPTHRLSYAIHRAVVPSGKMVCHSCDTPRCVNPDHLFLGDAVDNVRDMWSKGRASKPPLTRGEGHAKATLSDKQVVEICASTEPQREVAEKYGCSQSTVWRYRHGKTRVAWQ